MAAQYSATAIPHTALSQPLVKPEKYDADAARCQGFLLQLPAVPCFMWLFWSQQVYEYPQSDDRKSPHLGQHAMEETSEGGAEVQSMVEYALEFQTLSTESVWNEAVFWQGLNLNIITELAFRDKGASLDDLINLAVRLDNLPQHHRPKTVSSTPARELVIEPVQLNNTHLNPNERMRRWQDNLCFYCGDTDYHIAQCPMHHLSSKSPEGLRRLANLLWWVKRQYHQYHFSF